MFPLSTTIGSRKIKSGCYDGFGLNKEGQVAEVIDGTTYIKVMHDNVFEYEFKKGDMPISENSRPRPVSLKAPVRERLQAVLRDGILEESYSTYVNPLTLMHHEQWPIPIYVAARRINKVMAVDRVKVQPMRELLQRFHGSSYITSLEPSSAFLQVPLSKGS
jgi:hypothetical protein